MKFIRVLLFVLFFFSISGVSHGQNIKENELVVIQGEKFILHQVRTGETVYSISRNFKVDSSELLKYNPTISQGLSIGDILKIPFNENVDLSEIPNFKKGDPTGFINYTIESKSETAYSISKMYGITVEEIYAYNPSVRKLKKGTTLKIPQWTYELKPETKQTEISGQVAGHDEMIEHIVVSGETLYSIGKKYQVTESEILLNNPDAKNLKAGSKLYLPKKTADKTGIDVKSVDEKQPKYILHTIVSGETMFRITQQYHISEQDLVEVNPDLKTAFRAGTQIRIPVTESMVAPSKPINEISSDNHEYNQVVEDHISLGKTPEACLPGSHISYNKTINVALFLPLFLDANEKLNKDFALAEIDSVKQIETTETIEEMATDTIIEEEQPVQLLKQFYGSSEKFLQFYEGVIIAVDSIQKSGAKIKLNVYDTKDNPESVRSIINKEEFKATDLIIGPVYENIQKEVARVSAMNHIPMISPFTPKADIIYNYPQFYQINPTREYLVEETAEMIADNYANTNFIVVQTSPYEGTPEGQIVEFIKSKFKTHGINGQGKFTEYDFRKERSRGLPNILLPDKENVIFIPSSDEGELSVAISNLNNLANDYPITLIGASNYQQKYPSIEVAHFHNLKLKYINPYWINYQDSSTIAYFEKFISNFGTEPGSYGVQGFDASWYFLNAVHLYGKDFEDCLPYMKINLLQGNYYFKRVSQGGGYMNEGVSVISYNRNFEVERKRVIGKPEFETGN